MIDEPYHVGHDAKDPNCGLTVLDPNGNCAICGTNITSKDNMKSIEESKNIVKED